MNINKTMALLSARLKAEQIVENANMSEYTSFKAGGKARFLIQPDNMEELRYVLYMLGNIEEGDMDNLCADNKCCSDCFCIGQTCDAMDISEKFEQDRKVCDYCKSQKSINHSVSDSKNSEHYDFKSERESFKYMILGNGSNVLVRDGGYDGVIIKLGEGFDYIKVEGNRLVAGASALLSTLAKIAQKEGLTGFEFASGIPGSIGGAVFMNAGAYGGEIKDILEYVKVISKDGTRERLLTCEDLELSYRHSILCESGDIVCEVAISLKYGNREQIMDAMRELAARRNQKQPVTLPSAGSFFKRPEGHFAGALIEQAGLKGLTVGGARVSPLHAGFIVNIGSATATDIEELMHLVQNTVFSQTGVMLEPEVRIVGENTIGY